MMAAMVNQITDSDAIRREQFDAARRRFERATVALAACASGQIDGPMLDVDHATTVWSALDE